MTRSSDCVFEARTCTQPSGHDDLHPVRLVHGRALDLPDRLAELLEGARRGGAAPRAARACASRPRAGPRRARRARAPCGRGARGGAPWPPRCRAWPGPRGTATPPLPSPPRTAWCSRIASETKAWPTGRADHPRPVPGRHLLDEAGGGDVGDDRALPPGEGGFHRERQGQLLGERPARLVHEAQPLAVGVEHEAEVGVAREHDRPRLGGGGDRGLGRARGKGSDGSSLIGSTSQPSVGEPARDEARAGAVAAVDRHAQPPRPDRRDVEARRARASRWWGIASVSSTRVASRSQRGALDRALVEDVEELLPLDGAEVEAVAPHELERVPLRAGCGRR